MKLIALIPARYGSTRFPGKPLAPILGKPLIQRVYEQARLVKGLDELWVATDDARIRACVEGFGGRALMTQADHPSGSDRLAEAAQLLGLVPADLVVNIQGDQPLFPPELVAQLAALFRRDPEVVMATPARKFTDPRIAADPNVVKVVFDRRGRALYFSRSPLPCWFPVSSARDGRRRLFLPAPRPLCLPGGFSSGVRAPRPGALGAGGEDWSSSGPWSMGFPSTSWRPRETPWRWTPRRTWPGPKRISPQVLRIEPEGRRGLR